MSAILSSSSAMTAVIQSKQSRRARLSLERVWSFSGILSWCCTVSKLGDNEVDMRRKSGSDIVKPDFQTTVYAALIHLCSIISPKQCTSTNSESQTLFSCESLVPR